MSSREEFEAWASGFFAVPDFSKNDEGTYYKQWIRNYWSAWQASRQTLEIELPAHMNESTQSYERDLANMAFNEAVDDCREAIESAGVRVKSDA